MKITEILSPEMVVAQLRGGTKAEVLTELAQCLCKAHPEIPFERLLGVLNERERLGSTAIGDGIAIPHGKLRGITQILGVFGRSRRVWTSTRSTAARPISSFCWSRPRIRPVFI